MKEKTIGERIKNIREQQGLSQLELGIKIGLPDDDRTKFKIRDYEETFSPPAKDIIEKLEKALCANIISYADSIEINDIYKKRFYNKNNSRNGFIIGRHGAGKSHSILEEIKVLCELDEKIEFIIFDADNDYSFCLPKVIKEINPDKNKIIIYNLFDFQNYINRNITDDILNNLIKELESKCQDNCKQGITTYIYFEDLEFYAFNDVLIERLNFLFESSNDLNTVITIVSDCDGINYLDTQGEEYKPLILKMFKASGFINIFSLNQFKESYTLLKQYFSENIYSIIFDNLVIQMKWMKSICIILEKEMNPFSIEYTWRYKYNDKDQRQRKDNFSYEDNFHLYSKFDFSERIADSLLGYDEAIEKHQQEILRLEKLKEKYSDTTESIDDFPS